MSKQAFQRYLDSRTEPEGKSWEKRKQQWIDSVARLYQDAEAWLAEYIATHAVECSRERCERVEDHLGRYAVDALRIRFQGQEVRLTPVGANIIGALGAVDLEGLAGTVRLIYVPRERTGPRFTFHRHEHGAPSAAAEARAGRAQAASADLAWKLLPPPPTREYIDLNADIFLEALLYVVGARMQLPGE